MIHDLRNVDAAVATVRITPEPKRRGVVSEFLRGEIDYSSDVGRAIGARRATFCAKLRENRLWPER